MGVGDGTDGGQAEFVPVSVPAGRHPDWSHRDVIPAAPDIHAAGRHVHVPRAQAFPELVLATLRGT
jgi:hypothetical protein